MTPFGARLRAMRQARGITLSQLAANLGVSPTDLPASRQMLAVIIARK